MVVLAKPDIDQVDLPAGWACTVMILNAHHTVTTAGSGGLSEEGIEFGCASGCGCRRQEVSGDMGVRSGAGGRAVMIGVPPRVTMAGTSSVYNGFGWVAAVRFWRGTPGYRVLPVAGREEGGKRKRRAALEPLIGGVRGDEQHAQLLTGWCYGWVGGALAPPNRCERVCAFATATRRVNEARSIAASRGGKPPAPGCERIYWLPEARGRRPGPPIFAMTRAANRIALPVSSRHLWDPRSPTSPVPWGQPGRPGPVDQHNAARGPPAGAFAPRVGWAMQALVGCSASGCRRAANEGALAGSCAIRCRALFALG